MHEFHAGDQAVIDEINSGLTYGSLNGRTVTILSGPDSDGDYTVDLGGSYGSRYVHESALRPVVEEALAEAPEGFVAKKDVYRLAMLMAERRGLCSEVESVLDKLGCMPDMPSAADCQVGTVHTYRDQDTENMFIAIKVGADAWELTDQYAIGPKSRIRTTYAYKKPVNNEAMDKIRFRTELFNPTPVTVEVPATTDDTPPAE